MEYINFNPTKKASITSINEVSIQSVIASFEIENILISESTIDYISKRKNNAIDLHTEIQRLKHKYLSLART